MGEPNELRPGSGEFHENPSSCICQNSELKTGGISNPQNQTRGSLEEDKIANMSKDIGAVTEEQFIEEEQEWSDVDYLDSRNQIQLKGTRNASHPLVMRTDPAELQEFFSD